MKFDFKKVDDIVSKIEKDLKNLNRSLNELNDGFLFITGSNNWKSQTRDYYSKELKALIDSASNVDLVSTNVNSYLSGVLNNYNSLNDTSSLFAMFGLK